ncbi:MAG: RsbRD N-terminal domain-containing protein [Gemmatimonadales bacterium]
MQPSAPALVAVGRVMGQKRDALVEQWTRWVLTRVGTDPDSKHPEVERQLALLVDIMIQTAGPLRRQVAELWYAACEFHGRASAARGLAAGEVVEELQHLRELLIRHLSEVTAALPARQYLATVLRLNRILDKGIAHAVVGYTDALIETLFTQNGVPVSAGHTTTEELLDERLRQFEAELEHIREKTGEHDRA